MRRKPNGFSLIEMALALGVGSIVVLLTGDLIVNSQVQSQRSSVLTDADQIHLINLQRSRDPRFLRDQVYTGVTGGNTSNLQGCLTGKVPRTGCAGFNQTAPSVYSDVTIPSDKFFSRIQVSRECDNRGCQKIRIEVRTGDNDPNDKIDIFERHSVGYLPGYAFVDDRTFNMTCAPSIMTSLNPYSMQPICGAPAGNFQCSNGNRLMNFGQGAALNNPAFCIQMANEVCNSGSEFGTNMLGILVAQPICQGFAGPTGSACSPVWTPLPETYCDDETFIQRDGCGFRRTINGTQRCWAQYPSTTMSNWAPPPVTTTTTPPPATTTSTTTSTTTTSTTVPPTGPPRCGTTYTTSYVNNQVAAGNWTWQSGGTSCTSDVSIWFAATLNDCYTFNYTSGAWSSGPGFLCMVSVAADPGYTCSGARAIRCGAGLPNRHCPMCPSGGYVLDPTCTSYSPGRCGACGPAAPVGCGGMD